MAYRNVFEMQQQWGAEVVKCINEWANGRWDANEMRMKKNMHNWLNEPMNQGMHEHRSTESLNKRINEAKA